TEQSGVPGNVMVLNDGATDELFSNLAYSDVDNIERIVATHDENDRKLTKPISVKTVKRGTKTLAMASKETYCVINQVIPNSNNRRRFVQVRIIVDPEISAAVHNIDLLAKDHEWFKEVEELNGEKYVQCVLGQGAAVTLGEDAKKKSLEPGDTFELGDLH